MTRYPAQVALSDTVRTGRWGIGWLLLGFALATAGVYALNVVLIEIAAALLGSEEINKLATGTTPTLLLIALFSFAFWVMMIGAVQRLLHRLPLRAVAGQRAAAQFWVTLRALVVLYIIVMVLPPWGLIPMAEPNLALGTWVMLLPVSLAAVLIQVGAEELLFRGYLQQHLAARLRHPIFWMGLPSALFAIGHYAPTDAGPNAWLIVAWAGMFGVLMADLTARAGSIGPAIAVHFVNNVLAILVVSVPDSLDGLALYTLPFSMSDTDAMRAWLPVDFAHMFVSWLAARLAVRR